MIPFSLKFPALRSRWRVAGGFATTCTLLFLGGLIPAEAGLVQTRHEPRIAVDAQASLVVLDPALFFQTFADDRPEVQFHIDLPISTGVAEDPVLTAYGYRTMHIYQNSVEPNYGNTDLVLASELDRRREVVTVKLDPATAPLSVANFLRYVQDDAYARTLIHRNPSSYSDLSNLLPYSSPLLDGPVTGYEIIQGGLINFNQALTDFGIINAHEPISLEDNGSNTAGTLALARTDEPDSATSQWYFNLDDNSPIFDKSGSSRGYAVIGEVSEGGLELIREIAGAHWFHVFNSFPTVPLYLGRRDEAADFVYFENITYTPGNVQGIQYGYEILDYFRTHARVTTLESNPPKFEANVSDFRQGSFLKVRLTAQYQGESMQTLVYLHQPAPGAEALFHGTLYEDNWVASPWYGWYWVADYPWILHPEHGWQYAITPDAESTTRWIYDMRLGWLATDGNIYPWVYLAKHGFYARYLPGGSPDGRWFFTEAANAPVTGWFLDINLGD